jgi:hypothetical protein
VGSWEAPSGCLRTIGYCRDSKKENFIIDKKTNLKQENTHVWRQNLPTHLDSRDFFLHAIVLISGKMSEE